MLRILGRTSSINVRKVLWTAAECDLPFRHEDEWGIGRDVRGREFLALNPNGQIPVVETEDGVLWESNAICRYLAAKSGRIDLLPAAPFARFEVERWMDWQATDLNFAFRPAFLALVRKDLTFVGDDAAVARSLAQWNALMLTLERQLARTGAYVAGSTFTLADIVLGLSHQRWLLTPMQRPETPALDSWRDRLRQRPATRSIAVDMP